jgi:hypothetical protein
MVVGCVACLRTEEVRDFVNCLKVKLIEAVIHLTMILESPSKRLYQMQRIECWVTDGALLFLLIWHPEIFFRRVGSWG